MLPTTACCPAGFHIPPWAQLLRTQLCSRLYPAPAQHALNWENGTGGLGVPPTLQPCSDDPGHSQIFECLQNPG